MKAGVLNTNRRPRRMNDEVRFLLRVLIGVTLLLLFVNLGTRAYLLIAVQPSVNRLHSAQIQLDTLNDAMLDQETGERGYIASDGDIEFLQPYHLAVPVATASSADLAGLVGRGKMRADYLALDRDRQAWIDQWAVRVLDPATAAALAPGDGRPSANLVPFLLQGKTLFDRYRQAEDRLYSDLNSEFDHANAIEDDWLLGSGIFQAVVSAGLVASALAGRRRMVRRITDPVGSIAAAVNRIADGDLTAEVGPVRAPLELEDLNADVQRMAAALRASTELAAERAGQIQNHADRLALVLDAAREVAGSLDLRYVMNSVAGAVQALGADRVRIWLADDDQQTLRLAFDSSAGPDDPGGPDGPAAEAPDGTSIVGRAARSGRPVGPEPTGDDHRNAVAVPMTIGGRVVGVLKSIGSPEIFQSGSVTEVLEALASHAAGALASAQLHERTAAQAVTDALTGLPNRRAFEDRIDAEVARAERYGRPLSLIILDLDHFKALNDRFGHASGDLALQQAAAAVRGSLRQADSVFRLGGEEFAVIGPETPLDQAAELAERLRQAVEASSDGTGPVVTASFGVAEYPSDAPDRRSLMAAADRALYLAKERGRNMVSDCRPVADR